MLQNPHGGQQKCRAGLWGQQHPAASGKGHPNTWRASALGTGLVQRMGAESEAVMELALRGEFDQPHLKT